MFVWPVVFTPLIRVRIKYLEINVLRKMSMVFMYNIELEAERNCTVSYYIKIYFILKILTVI